MYEDLSGPEMRRLIALMNEEQAALCSAARGANAKPSFYVVGRIDASAIVSDEIGKLLLIML